jgi:hypothetical protein
MRHKNYMNMDSASTLVESLTKTELRRLLTQLSGDIELSNSANTADEL